MQLCSLPISAKLMSALVPINAGNLVFRALRAPFSTLTIMPGLAISSGIFGIENLLFFLTFPLEDMASTPGGPAAVASTSGASPNGNDSTISFREPGNLAQSLSSCPERRSRSLMRSFPASGTPLTTSFRTWVNSCSSFLVSGENENAVSYDCQPSRN